jgi:hypothetical protein
VIGRLLIQTGRRLDALTDKDFDDLLAASAARHGRGKASHHYSSAVHTARRYRAWPSWTGAATSRPT